VRQRIWAISRDVTTPWRSRSEKIDPRDEAGFTLIELIIVTLIIPVIIGALTLSLMAVFSLQGSTSNRISNSGDAQEVSSNFETDVQGASLLIAPTPVPGAPSGQSPATCGPGTEVLSLQSGVQRLDGTYPTEISYVIVLEADSTSVYNLVRNICQNGTLSGTTTVSHNVAKLQTASVSCSATLTAAQPLVAGSNLLSVSALPAAVAAGDTVTLGTGSAAQTVTASSASGAATALSVTASSAGSAMSVGTTVVASSWGTTNCGAATAWIQTSNISGVTFNVVEPAGGAGTSAYTYQLVGLPRASAPPNPPTNVSVPTATSCGFAAVGTGTYASSLCFIDFSAYVANVSQAYSSTEATSPGCLEMAATIEATYKLSFCLSVWGSPVTAASFPTYPQAFLGNNGFYTGVPNNPALYQTGGGTTTVSITGIQLTNANGNAATGWELVTGDAETTDAGESIIWTSNQPFSLLPNSSTSQIGDACSNPVSPSGLTPQSLLTGSSSLSVTCASSTSDTSSARTGTVMIGAPAPNQLTDTLFGTGLEGIFIGLLLPS
jgi:prepilin-type N-terminal cleavage/methylation domain-containing protein